MMAWLVFGLIGMAAFGYGKKQGNFNVLVLGGALMVYPYFVSDPLLLWGVGAALTAALFLWRS